jgi:hypothetical protein
MNKSKFRNRSRFHFQFVSLLILFPLSLTISPQQAQAAGGGGGGGGTITGAADTPTTGLTNTGTNSVQPVNQTNPNSNGFSYSQQFSGYGVNNGCGTQFSIGTNYGNSISPYSTTSQTNTSISQANTNSYTLGANIVFNSQQCSDPNKQLELQNKQIQSQKDINCASERNKFATIIFTAKPQITPQELDKMLDVVCK